MESDERLLEPGPRTEQARLHGSDRDAQDIGEEIEQVRKGAWSELTRRAGVQRALWIAEQTQPSNWTPELAVPDDDLEFPSLPDDKTHDWTRAPQTQLLPDQLDALLRLHPSLATNANFVHLRTRQLRPSPDVDWTRDAAETLSNGYVYELPEQHNSTNDQSVSFTASGFKSIQFANNLGVIKTMPGFAPGIASLIDETDPFDKGYQV